ncbi:hypothetical protein Q3G72_017913 [Acer saccharum]|nr:hypothetical protein Q3G72_017913 [Acer saccharum]
MEESQHEISAPLLSAESSSSATSPEIHNHEENSPVEQVFYKKHITFFVSLLVVFTTQVLGFGWAGIFRSTFFAITYGVGFAALTATVVHVALFHGREIWEQSKASFQEKGMDIHTRLMRRYKQVPEWWFVCILLVNIAVTIFSCEYYNDQLQLPWWGVLLACVIAITFTLPIGIITAITNQTPEQCSWLRLWEQS